MAAPEPTTFNINEALAQEPPFLKFPPFPGPPPGVTIMPFKDFKPRGIQLFSEPRKEKDDLGVEDDAELDALGIPTVELRIKHATDECKSNSRKKRKKKKTNNVTEAVPVKKLPWYEEWEEGEDLRVTKERYDSSVSAVDRFFQSAYDFRTGRPWPPITSGLNNLWDQFRLFTGLLINPSMFRKNNTRKSTRAESPDFDSDDSTEDVEESTTTTKDSRPTKRQRPDDGFNSDEDGDPQKSDEELREEKISVFLSDPEKAVRIFLSSYMREHGLIWAERHLVHAPRLISFFLAFVLRNRVLLEPTYQRGLKRALETIERAKKELPLTHKVGQSIPDAFNEACRECFGRKGGINWSVVSATAATTIEQKDASIHVADISSGVNTNVALPSQVQMQLKDAIEDNIDMEVSLNVSSTDVAPMNVDAVGGNGWDNGNGDGWGSWDQNAWAQDNAWGDEMQEGQGTNGGSGLDSKWADSDPTWNRDLASLFSLLGPSAFPLTHTTGIVECSTRRVSVIRFPPNHPKCVSSSPVKDGGKTAGEGPEWTPSASGVEAELDTRFAKVILEPWGREEGDISGPEIWDTSRGPVIDPKKPTASVQPAGARKPHNPLKDSITLLVEPSFAETLALVPGLGLGAMWIEIVRQKDSTGSDSVAEVDTDTPGRFWYHEDVTGIFPSFYTPREAECDTSRRH